LRPEASTQQAFQTQVNPRGGLGRLGHLRHARSRDDALASLRCMRSPGQLHGSPINFCTGIDTSSHRGRRPQSLPHLAVRACLNDNGRHHPASSPTPLATTCDLASVPAHLAALRARYSRQHSNASDNGRAASAAAPLRPPTVLMASIELQGCTPSIIISTRPPLPCTRTPTPSARFSSDMIL